MPKKTQKQPVNYDIVEVNEYPEDSENEEEVKKPSKVRPSQKKQVKTKQPKYVSESEEETETDEEPEPTPRVRKNKLPKGKVEVPIKTKIMSEARLNALAKGREIAHKKRLAKKNNDLEELKQKLWMEFEQKQPRDSHVKNTPVQQSINEVKKMMPKSNDKKLGYFNEPTMIVDFLNRKK